MDVASFLAQYLPPPMIGFLIGFGAGIAVGLFLSKPMWDYFADGRRFKREDRKAERQRKEAAAKRRLESCARRKAEAELREFNHRKIVLDLAPDPNTGIITDPSKVPYCPDCFRHHRIVLLVRQGNRGIACPECGFSEIIPQ